MHSGASRPAEVDQKTTLFIKRCLVGAGVSFLSMAAVCMLLYPEIFQHYEYGLSYFGSVPITFIPYYLGFGTTIILTVLVGWRLRSCAKTLSAFFYTFAICMTGVAATSCSLNHAVYTIHWGFAIALTVCILATIYWLVKQGGLSRVDYVLIVVVITVIAISALPAVNNIPVVKVYILRELVVFAGSLWLLGRANRTTTLLHL